MKYEEPRFHFQKPPSEAYKAGYEAVFGKKCVGVCKLSEGVCIGCNRTIKEIEEAGRKK